MKGKERPGLLYHSGRVFWAYKDLVISPKSDLPIHFEASQESTA